MALYGTNKPIFNHFNGKKHNIYDKFIRGQFLCGKADDNVRKYAKEFTDHQNMKIESMECDLCDYPRKHKMYDYEWAIHEKVNV